MVHRNEVADGVIRTKPRDDSERFTGAETLASATLLDFWQWAYSDIVVNTNRGCLAEFIVSKALGTTEAVKRDEWESYDLITPEKIRVEVKSSAYLQLWKQQKPSAPSFGIGKSFEWLPQTNDYSNERRRPSDVYVFCLLAYRGDKELLNPLDMGQWNFYVVATRRIDEAFGKRKQVSLAQVQNHSRAYAVDELSDAVKREKNR